jgi:hypothetical protein
MKPGFLILFVLCWPLCSQGQEASAPVPWTEAQLRYQAANDLQKYAVAAAKWHKDIAALRKLNSQEANRNSILFMGSSSIRLWTTADKDLAPYSIVRRGYGGAKYCDLAIHAESLLEGLTFKAAVVFVGNDISGDGSDKTPEEIARLAKLVIDSLRRIEPKADIFLVGITPTPKRFEHWPKISAANLALEQVCHTGEHLTFIKTDDRYLNEEGKPRQELFSSDDLHQNEEGYKLWASILKASLDRIQREP